MSGVDSAFDFAFLSRMAQDIQDAREFLAKEFPGANPNKISQAKLQASELLRVSFELLAALDLVDKIESSILKSRMDELNNVSEINVEFNKP